MIKKLNDELELPNQILDMEKERINKSIEANEEVIESYTKSIEVHTLALTKLEGVFELEDMCETYENIIEKHTNERKHYEAWNEKARIYLALLEESVEKDLNLVKAFMNLH